MRARTHVPCIGRWILNHCATREVPRIMLNVEKTQATSVAQERKILQGQAVSLNTEDKEIVMDSIAVILTALRRHWQCERHSWLSQLGGGATGI